MLSRFVFFKKQKDYKQHEISFCSWTEERLGSYFMIAAFGYTLKLLIPQFMLRPSKTWVDTSKNAWSSPRGGYWQIDQRKYGMYQFENHFVVLLGRQSHSSSTTQSWSTFLPWNEWRHTRYRIFDKDFNKIREDVFTGAKGEWSKKWDITYKFKESIEKVRFCFFDYDDELIWADTYVEEREYERGEKWFKWLSIFWPTRVYRSLDMAFDKEVGDRKGSWKGGTLGTSIAMEPTDNHETAFRRWLAINVRSKQHAQRWASEW
jgi:hypothetical protein